MPQSGPDQYKLVVPAQPVYVATARLFIAGTAAVAGLDQEIVDDAKLAVSEIATAIVASGAADDLVVQVRTIPQGLELEIGPWPGQVATDDLGAIDLVDVLFPGTWADGVVHIQIGP
jgi:hypothetical protein